MPQRHRKVHLTNAHRTELEAFVASGKKSAREITRARILLLAADGKGDSEISRLLGICRGTVYTVRKKYTRRGPASLVGCLKDEPRSGRPIKLDSRVEAQVTMIACSAPPAGCGRWTLHLIADQLVKLEVTDAISHESVRRMLKKTVLSRG